MTNPWDPPVLAADLDRPHLLSLAAYHLSFDWSRLQLWPPARAPALIVKHLAVLDVAAAAAVLRAEATAARVIDPDRARRLVAEAAGEEERADAPADSGELDEAALAHDRALVAFIRDHGLAVILTLNPIALPA